MARGECMRFRSEGITVELSGFKTIPCFDRGFPQASLSSGGGQIGSGWASMVSSEVEDAAGHPLTNPVQ
jgi:hypothetical protein